MADKAVRRSKCKKKLRNIWKRVAANGKTVGASSEGYQRLRSARENFRRAQMVMNLNTETEIIEINGEEA